MVLPLYPNVRSGIELEFVDPTGSGEYRLARNPDEKDALIQIPGAGPTFAELAGIETRADRIGNLGGFGRVNYSRSQDSPFEVMDLFAGLDRDQPFERNFLGSATDTPIVDDNPINFETQINCQRLTLARLIDSHSLEPGEYQIQIRIRDHVSGQTITPSATFTIVP